MNVQLACPTQTAEQGRKIIHVDMDCFYAAVEEREQPHLRGMPLAVGGSHTRRGVLTTCNYEARKYGVHSAMPTFQALLKCPGLVVVPTRFDLYRAESAPNPRDFSGLHAAGGTAVARRGLPRCQPDRPACDRGGARNPRTHSGVDRTDRVRGYRAEQNAGQDRQRP